MPLLAPHYPLAPALRQKIYLVSLARGARIETGIGTYSVHHVQPAFFDGYESLPDSGVKLALPEKALVDFLSLSPTRGRLFAALPELELPRNFRRRAAHSARAGACPHFLIARRNVNFAAS